MVLARLITVGAIAIVITIAGVMTIGLAETVRYGLFGLAAAGLLMGFLWLSGRNARRQAASGDGQAPPAKRASGPGSKGKPKA